MGQRGDHGPGVDDHEIQIVQQVVFTHSTSTMILKPGVQE